METTNTFDPRRFVTRVGGADYLEVKWRVYWLRTQHPDAVITTELISHENSVAVFKAHVSIPGGGSSTGWGSEGYDDFRDYLEKAETKALGRALAALGFGTQFTPDFDFAEGQEKVVDAPVRLARQRQLVDFAQERQGQAAERQSMTDRQKSFIRQMAREKGLSDQAVDAQVTELFGKSFDQLDRRDASAYIERLKSVEPLAKAS
ncbi:MAG TPA: hypothetical protein VFP05_09340 [Thermomicrobiales bacterium]|nr:hypothetical protein [Thermomicrobiales bacterium]